MKSIKKKTIKILLGIAKVIITCWVIFFIYKKINAIELFQVFRSINIIFLIPPFLLYMISKYFTAERFRIFFNEIDTHINFKANIKLYLLGMYCNLFLPGGISGDALKIYYLNRKYKTKYNKLIAMSLIDRISGIIALVALGLFLAPFVFANKNIGLAVLGIPVIYFVFYESLKIIFSSKIKLNTFIITNIQSMTGQLLQIFAIAILIYLLGIKENYMAYILIFLISSIISIIPFTIGGIGARELTFIYGAQYLNLDVNLAFTISFMFYIITVMASFSGIYFSLFPEKIFPKDFKSFEVIEN